jgi:hypothetical protein
MAEARLLVDQVSRIVALDSQPVLRNLLITQCYHDLSSELARVLGASNANWCTFATWASRTAGRFIRNEEVPALFRKLLEDSQGFQAGTARILQRLRALHPAMALIPEHGLLGLADKIVDDVSAQIVAGNLKVFAELAPVFSSFIHLFDSGRFDERGADRLLASLRVGPSGKDGQSLLREAMENFVAAARESDPIMKAQYMLVANAQTGLHEQIRLQPYIAGSLDAPVEDALGGIWEKHHALAPEPSLFDRIHALWDRMGHALVRDAEDAWERFSSEELMTLAVPGEILRLGKALPPVQKKPLYPEMLQAIKNDEAYALLEQYDALDPEAEGRVGADDWTSLAQRMRYILALFRSRQQEATLLGQPFADAQRAELWVGRVPAGQLS